MASEAPKASAVHDIRPTSGSPDAHAPRRRSRLHVEGRLASRSYAVFVCGLATELGLGGFVRPDTAGYQVGGVWIEVEGEPSAVEAFVVLLRTRAPGDAVVERVTGSDVPCLGGSEFAVAAGRAAGERAEPAAADTAVCAACVAQLRDPGDRRYRYAFTTCAGCGPRYSLTTGLAGGGRPATTMAPFPMCPACRAEYEDPAGRRFRAEATCCPDCGPALFLADPDGAGMPGDPVDAAARLLTQGQIVAVKGTGGYQLCADATSAAAVAALRARLPLEERPFAVLCRDLAAARELCEVDEDAAAVLRSRRHPLVVLPRLDLPGELAPAVAPGSRELAVGLPSTGLLHLLTDALRRPLVLIAAEPGGEAAPRDNDDARKRLTGIADAFLGHDRRIGTPAGATVVRVAGGRELPLRRGLGYAPEALVLPWSVPRPVLAVGTDAGGTPCLAAGRRAVLLPEFGDVRAAGGLAALAADVRRLYDLVGAEPRLVAHDADPDALTTMFAQDLAAGGLDLVVVPRSHAHVASCLADNGEWGPVIGVVLPGDTRAGEFLVGDLDGFTLAGRLETNPVDAVAVLCGLGDRLGNRYSYPGRAAAELEQLADPSARETYLVSVTEPAGNGLLAVRSSDLVRGVTEDLRQGVPRAVVTARFHRGLADAVLAAAELVRDTTGISTVALSGGLFGNALLLDRVCAGLAEGHFRVLTHHRVPPGDGGVALGQAVVAAARSAHGAGVERPRPAP